MQVLLSAHFLRDDTTEFAGNAFHIPRYWLGVETLYHMTLSDIVARAKLRTPLISLPGERYSKTSACSGPRQFRQTILFLTLSIATAEWHPCRRIWQNESWSKHIGTSPDLGLTPHPSILYCSVSIDKDESIHTVEHRRCQLSRLGSAHTLSGSGSNPLHGRAVMGDGDMRPERVVRIGLPDHILFIF